MRAERLKLYQCERERGGGYVELQKKKIEEEMAEYQRVMNTQLNGLLLKRLGFYGDS